jgi:gluconate kinase
MEGKKSKPRALLIFGAPCSGKTTFSERFAHKFELAYFNLDELKTQNRLTRKNILLMVDVLARTKKDLILEGGIDTEKERTEVRNILRAAGYEPTLVWIQTDLATIRLRMKMRHRSISMARKAYDAAVANLEAPTDVEKPIILSGKHTFDTQTKHILSGLATIEQK